MTKEKFIKYVSDKVQYPPGSFVDYQGMILRVDEVCVGVGYKADHFSDASLKYRLASIKNPVEQHEITRKVTVIDE